MLMPQDPGCLLPLPRTPAAFGFSGGGRQHHTAQAAVKASSALILSHWRCRIRSLTILTVDISSYLPDLSQGWLFSHLQARPLGGRVNKQAPALQPSRPQALIEP